METSLEKWIGKQVLADMAGKRSIEGIVIEAGADLLVMQDRERFVYMPLAHVQRVRESLGGGEAEASAPAYGGEVASMEGMLKAAEGRYVELQVGGSVLEGFVTAVKPDYLQIYTPLYPGLSVALKHLKWLVPYPMAYEPYPSAEVGASAKDAARRQRLAESFRGQVKLAEGRLALLNVGGPAEIVGMVRQAGGGMVEIGDANGESAYYLLDHLKSLYMPPL
ncbi:hypothetical protein SAMN02799624_04454 [Paenibacillus sp. UNC496MF]|uniref:hypothetical protein n=1 Tax=Paenibacillus sp. UNC496MF TaxID=1502753 RepID=UPI0008E53AA4|nr:hypothetical protein [Paenibacillus sp. UNC496MF]SFJ42836.1 hypothetical protein SAMN02799624_04454 [Paenibacillus sp. UNC496MF]